MATIKSRPEISTLPADGRVVVDTDAGARRISGSNLGAAIAAQSEAARDAAIAARNAAQAASAAASTTAAGVSTAITDRLSAAGASSGIAYKGGLSVQDALDRLLYQAPAISSLAASPSQAEIGSTVTVTVSWTLTGSITGQTLKGAGLPIGNRSATYSGVAASTTYDLVVTDAAAPGGAAGDAKSAAVTFLAKYYAGVLDATTITDAQLRGFAAQGLAAARGRSLTFDASAGGYPYYAWPASLGAIAGVTVGGLAMTDYSVTTRDVVNASGASISMNILRFNNRQTGAAIGVTFA
jgi:hypothetical protein